MVDQNAADNTKAERYVVRSADRENLEASDAFCGIRKRSTQPRHEGDLRRCVQSLRIL